MSKTPNAILKAEELVRDVLTKTRGQKIDAETVRLVAEQVVKAVPSVKPPPSREAAD
jgi:hypothetical protein